MRECPSLGQGRYVWQKERTILHLTERPVIRVESESLAVSVIQGLLSSIPAFWSSHEISVVLTLVLDRPDATSSIALGKAIVKRLPAKALIAALFELWDKASTNTVRPLYRFTNNGSLTLH